MAPSHAAALARLTCVPRSSPRADGWTAGRQRAFVAVLAGAESGLARAWAATVGEGQMRALDFALEQSFAPDMVAIMRGGRQVGWRTRDVSRLAFVALQALDGLKQSLRLPSRRGHALSLRNKITPERNEISERPGN